MFNLYQVAIHNLQHHENLDIYKKCFYIMDKYFPEGEADRVAFINVEMILIPLCNIVDEEEEAGEEGAPAVDASGQYAFNSDCKLALNVKGLVLGADVHLENSGRRSSGWICLRRSINVSRLNFSVPHLAASSSASFLE